MAEKGELENKLRTKMRRRGLARRTESSYVSWYKHYVKFHGMKHPVELGQKGIEDFLNYLASVKKVASSTQNQAFSALLFIYRDVPPPTLKLRRDKWVAGRQEFRLSQQKNPPARNRAGGFSL